MKVLVSAFNQEKALVGAFSVIVKTDVVVLTRVAVADAGNIPEEYYSYLETWYRSQISAHNMLDLKPGTAPGPDLHSSLRPPFSLQQVSGSASSSTASTASITSPGPGSASSFSSPVFIPVAALQHLRASLPGGLPSLGAAGRASHHPPCSAVMNLEPSTKMSRNFLYIRRSPQLGHVESKAFVHIALLLNRI